MDSRYLHGLGKMSRPQQHYDDPQYGQGGQTDSYYQDDYGPQAYGQQGDGYYEEQYVSVVHITTWGKPWRYIQGLL